MWGVWAAFAVLCLASVALAQAPMLQFSGGSSNWGTALLVSPACR